MSAYCKELIMSDRVYHLSKCTRKAVKDGFCKQHHPDAVAERRVKSDALYEAKKKVSAPYRLGEALEEIKRLRAELQQHRWIPMSERLPTEDDGTIVVWAEDMPLSFGECDGGYYLFSPCGDHMLFEGDEMWLVENWELWKCILPPTTGETKMFNPLEGMDIKGNKA